MINMKCEIIILLLAGYPDKYVAKMLNIPIQTCYYYSRQLREAQHRLIKAQVIK